MNFIKTFPRVVPNPEELLILNKLLQECPSMYKNSSEYFKLEEFKNSEAEWDKNITLLIEKEDFATISEFLNNAQSFPVDNISFMKVSENLACFE